MPHEAKSVTDTAKAALYRLSELGLPPTPENYARHYYEILGSEPQAPTAKAEEETAPAFDPNLLEEVGRILDSVTDRASRLAQGLNSRNQEMRARVDDLHRAEEKQAMLKLLGSILNTTDSILASTEDTYDGLLVTRQALEQIKTELHETRRLAQEDALTGMQNRRGMELALVREVEHAHRHGMPLSLAMLDIDHFKRFNDRYGHDAGDKMLLHLTTIMRSVQRESDVLVRYGGEEFLLILPDADLNGARFMLDRLRNLVATTPLNYEGRKIAVTFSAGLAQLKAGETGLALTIRADNALYEAKRAGRNCIKITAD